MVNCLLQLSERWQALSFLAGWQDEICFTRGKFGWGLGPFNLSYSSLPGRVAQSITCLVTDACLTADPGVASSIPALVPYFRGD